MTEVTTTKREAGVMERAHDDSGSKILDDQSKKRVKVKTFAYRGAVCIHGSPREMINTDPIKLEYHINKYGALQLNGILRIPDCSDCDNPL